MLRLVLRPCYGWCLSARKMGLLSCGDCPRFLANEVDFAKAAGVAKVTERQGGSRLAASLC